MCCLLEEVGDVDSSCTVSASDGGGEVAVGVVEFDGDAVNFRLDDEVVCADGAEECG